MIGLTIGSKPHNGSALIQSKNSLEYSMCYLWGSSPVIPPSLACLQLRSLCFF